MLNKDYREVARKPIYRRVQLLRCSPWDLRYMPREGLFDGVPLEQWFEDDRRRVHRIQDWCRRNLGGIGAFTTWHPLVLLRTKPDPTPEYQLFDGYHRLYVARTADAPWIHCEVRVTESWYPVMDRWSDQTGIAHLLDPNAPVARAWCGARVYALGNGAALASDLGCHPCRRCAARAHKQRIT